MKISDMVRELNKEYAGTRCVFEDVVKTIDMYREAGIEGILNVTVNLYDSVYNDFEYVGSYNLESATEQLIKDTADVHFLDVIYDDKFITINLANY